MATTVTLKPNAIDISGSTSGTTTLQATAVAGTTTITLPAATDTLVGKATTDTLTNKTLTGAVMNGTVGATTPSTGAFTTLSATGVTTVQAGTAAAPAITTSGDTDTGIFFPAADTIAFSEGGAEAMRIDSSGNVTISSDQISSATSHVASQHAMVLRSATTNQRSIVAVAPNGSGGLADFCISATSDLQTNYNQIRIGSDGTGFFVNSEKGGTETLKSLRFGVGGTALTIDTSNNVGIGTSSPSVKFQVDHSSDVAAINASGGGVTLKMSNSSANDVLFRMTNNSNNFYDIRNLTSGSAFTIGYNGDERMRISSAGRVSINTTYADTQLNIAYNGGAVRGVDINNTVSGNQDAIYFRTNGTNVGRINTDASNTSYVTSSDYRLKENITPMTGGLSKVALLKPVTYKWKVDGSNGQGFIAHELAEVVPDCVTGEKDAVETYTDEDGNEQTRIKPQGIDTSFLVATLTAAIQEQQALITSLTARIAALESK